MPIIEQFRRDHPILEHPKMCDMISSAIPGKPKSGKSLKPRHIHLGHIFNSGRSIQEIMDVFDIKGYLDSEKS